MGTRLVWISNPYATAAKNQSGLVEVDNADADTMIAAGDAQEWFGNSANDLKPIQTTAPAPPPPAPSPSPAPQGE